MEASVSTTDPGTPAPASSEEVRDRATQLVDAANARGNLELSDADRNAIVDQVVAALGPLIGTLSEEDVNRVVDQMIERMAELGAFSPAPQTASGATPAPAPEVAAEAAAEVAATQAPPEKLTWAEKHFPNR